MASKPRRDNAAKGKTFPHRRGSDAHHLPDSLFADQYDPDNVIPMRQTKSGKKTPAYLTEPAHKPIELVGQTPNQQAYINSLVHGTTPFIVAHGPAGTGKTFPCVTHAIRELKAGNVKRIVITRPLVNVEEEEVGTLPGGIIEKVSPWMLPILDILKEHYSVQELKLLLEKEIIEIAPLAFMRGRTFKGVWLIADEMQNATPKQFKMLLTRIGEGSRFVITGDIEQTDRKAGNNGLADLTRRLFAMPSTRFANHKFVQEDVVRHEAIEEVLDIYAEAA